MISTITLDTYKQQISSGDAFNLSDSFNGRVGDEQVPLVVQFKERGLAQQFQDGLVPFLSGFVGSLDENDQVTAATGEAVSYVGTSDDIVGLGRVKMNLPGTMFPQEGYFYGFLGLQNADGKRVTTFNIWFHVYNGNPDMFVNKAPFRTELQKVIDAFNDLLASSKDTFSTSMNDWKQQVTALLTDLNGDYAKVQTTVNLIQQQLTTLEAQIKSDGLMTQADFNKEIAVVNSAIAQKAYQFNTNDALNSSSLKSGDLAITQGNAVAGDGGDASYRISAENNGNAMALQNGLFANLLAINGLINVLSFPGSNDSEKLLNAVNYVTMQDNTHALTLTASRVLNITQETIIDCKSKTFNVNLQICPSGGIGSALLFKNGIAMDIKMHVEGGGNDTETDAAIEICAMSHCIMHISGNNYKGTLFKVSGKDADSTHCLGMKVTLRNYNCNQTLLHGDPIYPASGFGYYDDVFEETYDASKPIGSLIRGTYDVSFGHYESHFVTNENNQTDLHLIGVHSCYFGYLALGGKCDQLLNIGADCSVSIDTLHLGSEAGTAVNGMQIAGDSQVGIRQYRPVSVGVALNYMTGAKIDINSIVPNEKISKLITRDNKDLGYALLITSFTNTIPNKIFETEEYQVYKESFTNLPIVEGGTNPSGTPYPWYYQSGIIPKFSTSTLDNIYNDNALSLTLDSTVAAGSTKLIYINFPLAATEQPIFNLDFKAINLASDSKIKIICQFLDANNALIRNDVLRTIDGSQLSYQQFNFAGLNLIPEATPSGVSYFKFGFALTQGSNNNAKIVISKFAIRKALAH